MVPGVEGVILLVSSSRLMFDCTGKYGVASEFEFACCLLVPIWYCYDCALVCCRRELKELCLLMLADCSVGYWSVAAAAGAF